MLQALPPHTEIIHVSLLKSSNCVHGYVQNGGFRGTLQYQALRRPIKLEYFTGVSRKNFLSHPLLVT